MAKEGEDGQGNNVQEERQKILELQSEQFRMQEQLERLKNKKDALQDELQVRLTEYQTLETDYNSEQKKEEVKIQGQDKAKRIAAQAAEGDFIKKEVRKLLQKRVPVMAQNLDEDNDLHSGLDTEVQKTEEAQKTVHNTVLVNYVRLRDPKKYETLQVTYRIDTQTRPLQLLKDACAYWGCSQNDHNLCKKDSPTEVKEVVVDSPLVDILNIKAESVLFLVAKKDKEKWEGMLSKEAEKRKQTQALQQQAERAEPDDQTNSGGWVQTIMSAALPLLTGERKAEQKSEDFVDAFRQWPGIYHLLKDRSRSREDSVKWQVVPFSDWVIFAVLILLSSLIIGYQNSTAYYELKAGVQHSLIVGLPGENYRIADPERYLFDTFESSGPGVIWTEVTSGVSWDAGSLHLDGVNQHIRTRKPPPLVSRVIEVQAVLLADANCTEYYVAFGSTSDMLRFSWDCDSLAISAPGNVSKSVARDCSSGNPYSIILTLDVEGIMNIRDSSVCNNVTLQHDLHTVVGPLYMFVGATGNGIFSSISATTRVAEPVMNFKDIHRADDMWNWLGGPFIYQLFDEDSTLRRNYVPTGYMRIRQQKVKPKTCPREDIPSNLAKPCHWVKVNDDTRDEGDIPTMKDFQASQFQERDPDSRIWQATRLDIESPYGLIQHYYDSSGYAADYNMKAENLKRERLRAQQFNEDLDYFRSYWVTTSTRMIAIEVTLADNHLGGYVSVRLLLEISPSGAIAPSCLLVPFHITHNSGDGVAHGLNILRWIFVICLLMIFRVYHEGQRKSELGKSGLHYIFSFNGFLDQTIIGLFFANEYMGLQGQPVSPHELSKFYSYSTAADRQSQLRVGEAVFLSFLLGRWVTLMRLFPVIFRFFKTFSKAVTLIFYFLAMFLPVFCGNIFAANAIWQPFVFMMSSWSECAYVFFLSLQESFEVKALHESAPSWCLPFLIWAFISVRIFFLHMFLAIIVHCFFEVQLIEGIRAHDVKWSLSQWLDWLLWPVLFEKLGMGESGISKNRGSQQGAAKDDDDDSDEEDDAEGKRD